MSLFQPPPPPRPEIKPPSAMERLAKFAAYPDVPTCPLDGHELDIHFHGGVECPACGAEFELGRNDELLPLKEHVEQSAKMWPDTVPSDWKMAAMSGNPYPFLYSPTTGQLHWGWANGFHEPLKDRLRGQGEQLADDYIHGRYYPESDNVRWYDPAIESMSEQARKPKDDMIRRNFPQTPLQSPLEAPGGHVTDGDDWSPQLNGFGF